MKKVGVIAFDRLAGEFHAKQLEFLFENRIEAVSMNIQDIQEKGLEKMDLYCITTDALEKLPGFSHMIQGDTPVVMLHVTFSHDTLKQIGMIPAGSDVLLVNLNEPMAQEAITRLIQLGANHVNFIPYYPQAELSITKRIQYAVTPDEMRYVPNHIPHVINVGQRQMDSGTLVEIALKLKMYNMWESRRWKAHLTSIASNNYNFDELFGRALRLESGFQNLLDIMNIGIIGINEGGSLFIYNKKAETIFGLDMTDLIGQPADRIFMNIPFQECRSSGRSIDAKLIRIRNNPVSVGIYPIKHNQTSIGYLAMLQNFSEEEDKQHKIRSQLLNKGHTAKYTFQDIAGMSPAIVKIKEMADRMAKTSASILITGESGTGKELFAQAIHNASHRRHEPFIALNCAALPENLLESELFGYVDGAFTGAKKGGKLGLFEFAHKGTLFLDEVEGMSQMLQIKLLRVIQEREVMRLGDNRLISIDVRIVAATNRNLEKLVLNGEFREDLYYRLNTLPINLPPLRERKEDILPLMKRFMKENEFEFELTEPVREELLRHYWKGNIRELKNCAEYFSFLGKKKIEYDDFPPGFLNQSSMDWKGNTPAGKTEETLLQDFQRMAGERSELFLLILNTLYERKQSRRSAGREEITQICKSVKPSVSVYEVREILSQLEKNGYIRIARGRGGNQLTEKGMELLKK